MERVKVYSLDNCVQCNATKRKLSIEDIDYDEYKLEELPEKVIEFKNEGLLQAPIVEANGERWSGYRPDLLGRLAIGLSNT